MKNNHSNNEMTQDQVIAVIRRTIKERGLDQRKAADLWGISEAMLSLILSGKKKPSKEILDDLEIEHIDKYRYKKK